MMPYHRPFPGQPRPPSREKGSTLPARVGEGSTGVAAAGGSGPPRAVRPAGDRGPVRRVLKWIGAVLFWLAFAAAVLLAYDWGVRLRQWTWETCRPVHYQWDMNNAMAWGTRVLAGWDGERATTPLRPGQAVPWRQLFSNYLHFYDATARTARRDAAPHVFAAAASAAPEDLNYQLDYAPGKLLVMTVWMRQVRAAYPDPARFANPYNQFQPEYIVPLLRFNQALELASAVAMFLLVRYWVDRHRWAGAAPKWRWSRRAVLLGLLAAVLFWFNPALILDAHGWPQWDSWLLPFYLFAVLLAGADWFFAAGLVLALGSVFKGQLLLVAPIFVLWPLFQFRLGAVARLAGGFALMLAVLASPWLLGEPEAQVWTLCTLAAVALLVPCIWWRPLRLHQIGLMLIALALLLWPWWFEPRATGLAWGVALAAVALGGAVSLPRKALGPWAAAVLAGGAFLAARQYGASWAWWDIGFGYGTRHYLQLANRSVCNLPSLLSQRFHWRLPETLHYYNAAGQMVDIHVPIPSVASWPVRWVPTAVPMRSFLIGLYLTGLVLASIGAAIHHRRHDKRFLIAMVVPWLLLFTFLAQVHQRYLMWGGALASAAVAVDVGLTLAGVLLSLMTVVMMLDTLLAFARPDPAPDLLRYLHAACPDMGWAIIFFTLVFLYVAVRPGPRRPRAQSAAAPVKRKTG
jgi:hypothetical protein